MRKLLLILAAFCLVSFWSCSENPTIDDEPTIEQTPGDNSNDNGKDDDGDETENDGSETPDNGESDENGENGEDDENTTPDVKFESNTDTEPTIEADGGEIEVTFTATAEWTAAVIFGTTEPTRSDAWCAVYPESGEAGTATITVAVKPNESTEERSATIAILCGEVSISLSLTQSGIEEKEEEEPNKDESIPNNEIHYTTLDGNIVTLNPDAGEYPFGEGVSIISHIYENGQGIITCNGDITTIENRTFGYCENLTTITIPNSITTIGEFAFGDCRNLKAFYGKYASKDNRCLIIDGILNSFAPAGLTSYIISDSVTIIGSLAFAGCGITNITIPNSVTTIGASAFNSCTSLISITIPDSVTTIGSSAFIRCTGLTNLIIGNSVTSIEYVAFSECENLASVTIGNNVTTIGLAAFSWCTSLTSITIPDSITMIEDRAFSYCSGLTSIYCKAVTPPSLGGYGVFYGNNNAPIYVPEQSVEAYKTAEGWSSYAYRIYGYDF